MKKFISLVLLIVSFSILMLGCSQKKEISAEQTAQALYDLYIFGDGKESKEIGLTDDEINFILDQQKINEINNINTNFINAGLPISDKELENLYELQKDSLKKLTVDISIEEISENKITLKLSTNYIDIQELDSKAALEAISAAENLTNDISELSKSDLSKLYIEKLNDNLKSVEPSSQMLEATFTFTKEKFLIDNKAVDVWFPEEPEIFAQTLVNMAVGIEY